MANGPSNSPAFTPPLNSVSDTDPPDIISVGKKTDVEIGSRTSQQSKADLGRNPFSVRHVKNGG